MLDTANVQYMPVGGYVLQLAIVYIAVGIVW